MFIVRCSPGSCLPRGVPQWRSPVPEVQHLFTAPIRDAGSSAIACCARRIGALVGRPLIVPVLFTAGRVSSGFMVFAGLAIIMATLNRIRSRVFVTGQCRARSWLPRAIAAAAVAIFAGTVAIH